MNANGSNIVKWYVFMQKKYFSSFYTEEPYPHKQYIGGFSILHENDSNLLFEHFRIVQKCLEHEARWHEWVDIISDFTVPLLCFSMVSLLPSWHCRSLLHCSVCPLVGNTAIPSNHTHLGSCLCTLWEKLRQIDSQTKEQWSEIHQKSWKDNLGTASEKWLHQRVTLGKTLIRQEFVYQNSNV